MAAAVKAAKPRVGVASILQETNTWSVVPTTMADFLAHGISTGEPLRATFAGTNTEIAGAIEAVEDGGGVAVPLLRAWANTSGRLLPDALEGLWSRLEAEVRRHRLDAMVLSLHGAMAGREIEDADAEILARARTLLGPSCPIGVCLDLHANVTERLVAGSAFVIGYHTYPHVDFAATGARAGRLLMSSLLGDAAPVTRLAKRPMVLPAETLSTNEGPLARLRASADGEVTDGVLDVSLFPVQPWLDVSDLGFGVTVTTDADARRAAAIADTIADMAWHARGDFHVELLAPATALARARSSSVRPFILSESSDAPTAGGSGDSPAMISALLEHGSDLRAYTTVADAPAVRRCFEAGLNADVELHLGATVDRRFHDPVVLRATVTRLGEDPIVPAGPSYTGAAISIGRWAVVRSGRLHVVISERPPFTLDPAIFEQGGLDLAAADVVVVRSANGFRAAYPPASAAAAVILDLPGASTPRLQDLDFRRAPRPLYPFDTLPLAAEVATQ